MEVARPSRICVDFCCLLHVCSALGRPSSVRVRARSRLRPVLHRSPQRKRQSDSLWHCSHTVLCNTVNLMATIVSYIKVAKMIRQHNADASSTIQRSDRIAGISAHEIKVSKSLFAVVFALMICWIPFWVIVILRRFRLVAKMPRNVELLCMFLLYFSNRINSFIYAGMIPVFKRAFRKILFCQRRRKVDDVTGDGRTKTAENETLSRSFHKNRVREPNTSSELNNHIFEGIEVNHKEERQLRQLTLKHTPYC